MTYDDIAAAIGMKLCAGEMELDGGTVDFDYNDTHRKGYVWYDTIHWTSRRVTRHGIRNFLKVAAQARLHQYTALNPAEQLGRVNIWASRTALEVLHVRLPSRYSDADRARARWLISKGNQVSPAVQRWARERNPTHA